MKSNLPLWAFFLLLSVNLQAQSVDSSANPAPAVVPALLKSDAVRDSRVRDYLVPKKVLWSTGEIQDESLLLTPPLGQTSTSEMTQGFYMKKNPGEPCAILLDFGAEIHGGVRLEARNLSTPNAPPNAVRARVRFGESADEAMAEPQENPSVTEHSSRDNVVNIPWLGAVEIGESAFRFVRIDLVDDNAQIWFDSIRATFVYRDLPQLGNFSCSDARLTQIWNTCAYTQFLTMQGYIFEGAKRDRLVWYGDFHPQSSTTLAVFGAPKVLRDTLGDYARSVWPMPKWMNGMPNYSLWWTISVSDYFRWTGDMEWLGEQKEYLQTLYQQLIPFVKEDQCTTFETPFLDWPTEDKPAAKKAGTHALFAIAFDRFAEMARSFGENEWAQEAADYAAVVRAYHPDNAGNKQAASLLAIAGIEAKNSSNISVVARNGAEGFSTFYGYYMLEALAVGNEKNLALDVIRDYWGGMLDVGATTFWEDFDLNWLKNAGRIDELTPEGLESLHGDRGAYCYVGFRHSLCHGWSSGPAAWLTAHVLGVTPAEVGYKSAYFEPFLGDLDWAEGDVPTPYGPIHIRLDKNDDGSVRSSVQAPEEVRLITK